MRKATKRPHRARGKVQPLDLNASAAPLKDVDTARAQLARLREAHQCWDAELSLALDAAEALP